MSASPKHVRHSPLRGVTVVDLTNFLSGPFCTQILGDLGATILKIEPPEGDMSRGVPPHFVGSDSAYYLSTNRNKKSIAIDLKHPAGVDLARSLIQKADVVVDNFRPGVCSKLGLDPQDILETRPDLIWASISGFGQDGPFRNNPAYDMIVQALSGVMSLTGEIGRPSVRLGIPAGDIVAGLYAAISINALLFDRRLTGCGGYIDVGMLDGQLSLLSYQAQYHLVSGTVPGPQGSRHDSIPTYRTFMAGDGRELIVTAITEKMWLELCDVLAVGKLATDPRFASAEARYENKEALWRELEQAFAANNAAFWVEALNTRGVPAAPIRNVAEAIEDARASGREMVIPLNHPDGRAIEMIGSPIKLAGVVPPTVFPPTLSQDSEEILTNFLNLRADQIADLVTSGAILTHPHQSDR